MRTPACLIAVVISIAPVSAAWAQSSGYGIAFDELYRVDLGSRQATLIGPAGVYAGRALAQFTGLTYGPGGDLYAVAATHKALIRINAATGAGSFVGAFGLAGQGSGQFDALDLSMTWGCSGQFWMTSAVTRELWTVDPANAVTTRVGNTGRRLSGLAMRNGKLYGTGIGTDQGLYLIDTTTAAATPIGAITGNIPWIDPSFASNGALWATFSYNPPQNREWSDLARIDPSTGVATNLGPITGPDSLRYISMKGLAVGPTTCQPAPGGGTGAPVTLPVRNPWGLLVLGLGLLAVATRRLRRA